MAQCKTAVSPCLSHWRTAVFGQAIDMIFSGPGCAEMACNRAGIKIDHIHGWWFVLLVSSYPSICHNEDNLSADESTTVKQFYKNDVII